MSILPADIDDLAFSLSFSAPIYRHLLINTVFLKEVERTKHHDSSFLYLITLFSAEFHLLSNLDINAFLVISCHRLGTKYTLQVNYYDEEKEKRIGTYVRL